MERKKSKVENQEEEEKVWKGSQNSKLKWKVIDDVERKKIIEIEWRQSFTLVNGFISKKFEGKELK